MGFGNDEDQKFWGIFFFRIEKKEQALFGSLALDCVPGTDLGVFTLHVAVGDTSSYPYFTSEETEA